MGYCLGLDTDAALLEVFLDHLGEVLELPDVVLGLHTRCRSDRDGARPRQQLCGRQVVAGVDFRAPFQGSHAGAIPLADSVDLAVGIMLEPYNSLRKYLFR